DKWHQEEKQGYDRHDLSPFTYQTPCHRGVTIGFLLSRRRYPLTAFDQHFAVGGHARFGEALRIGELQLDTNDLFDAGVAEVRVFGRERSLRINARDNSVERLFRIRVQVDARGLPCSHATDLAFGNKGAQVDLPWIQNGHDGGALRDDLARFGAARSDGAVK